MGFHAGQEAMRLLALSLEAARLGQVLVRDPAYGQLVFRTRARPELGRCLVPLACAALALRLDLRRSSHPAVRPDAADSIRVAARVRGALNLDPTGFHGEDLPADKDATLVFYCSNFMCRKAPLAARRAVGMGYRRVHVMSAGIKGWLNAALPTESGEARAPVAGTSLEREPPRTRS